MQSFLRSHSLSEFAHGFFGRTGGRSEGILSSLNCGYATQDNPENVSYNRSIVAGAIGRGGMPVCVANQIHSAETVVVTEAWKWQESPKVDALVTNVPGIILGVLTADCAPVLLADKASGVIGAAHAGWKGAVAGVIDSVVTEMVKLGASRQSISAVVGPCIALESYEVGEEFKRNVVALDTSAESYFADYSGRVHFDLSGYVLHRLKNCGVDNATAVEVDTYANESDYFSYRRSCHRSEADYGRQISVIAI